MEHLIFSRRLSLCCCMGLGYLGHISGYGESIWPGMQMHICRSVQWEADKAFILTGVMMFKFINAPGGFTDTAEVDQV